MKKNFWCKCPWHVNVYVKENVLHQIISCFCYLNFRLKIFFFYCSSKNKCLVTRWMGEKFITLSDEKQKMLSTKTLSRKATSCLTKVYITLTFYSICLCSDQSQYPFIINYVSSLSPSGKGKRWKSLYFILEGNDAQLIYFESEKRATKPKGLIDLSVCSVYGVHDSLFGRWDEKKMFWS